MIRDDFPSENPTGNVYLDTLINGGSFADGSGQLTTLRWTVRGVGVFEYVPGVYVTTAAWRSHELQALKGALQQWGNVSNVEFVYTASKSQADLIESLGTKSDTIYGDMVAGSHELPDGETNVPLNGVFIWNTYEWSKTGLLQGGQGFSLLLHELGHALGLAHPHADTAKSEAFPGVSNAQDLGDNDLNQCIWTVMSYNKGWDQEPIPDSATNAAYGDAGTPMAFDIAAIQAIYGANMSYLTGNDTYALPTKNGSGTFWNCLWDAGGSDAISNADSTLDCTIDLNAAPLTGEHAGGYVSHAPGITGGYTIANGVQIENAVGGKGDDSLVGNGAANSLEGGIGADTLAGGAGNDTLTGGPGNDVLSGGDGDDVLDGGAGEDSIDGGLGNDTVWYHQAWGKYFFTSEEMGIRVHWIDDPGGATELVKNVETFRFGEGATAVDLSAASLFGNHAPVLSAAIEDQALAVDEPFYFADFYYALIDINAGDELAYSFARVDADGALVGDGSLPGWLSLSDDVLSGAPSETDVGTFYIKVTATDLKQLGTSDIFAITVIAQATDDDDLIEGSGKDDVLQGLQGNDTLIGGAGFDTVSYADAEAAVQVDLAKKTAKGGAGADSVVGFEKCIGSDFNDALSGDAGNNVLMGEAGDDMLKGGKGDDTLYGGLGSDKLTGGAGNDVFVFNAASVAGLALRQADTIQDFRPVSDVLMLDTLTDADGSPGFYALSRADSSVFYSAEGAANAVADGQHLIYDPASGMLYYDVDGLGGANAKLVCQLVGAPQIKFADFVLIE